MEGPTFPLPRRASQRIGNLMSSTLQRNPHFDDDRVVWNDTFSGQYHPVRYHEQFDEQWKLFLERKLGFHQHTGVETANEYIDDRIREITGVEDYLLRKRWGPLSEIVKKVSGRGERAERRGIGGRLYLEPKFSDRSFSRKTVSGHWLRRGTLDEDAGIARSTCQSDGRIRAGLEVDPPLHERYRDTSIYLTSYRNERTCTPRLTSPCAGG